MWLTFRRANPVGMLLTYAALPSFDSLSVEYSGASELVKQYNFSASQDFYLRNRPRRPSGANFLLCIRYRVGTNVFRYKLWSGVGETGLDEVPLYQSQVIKKNFVLEVWNVGSSVLNATEIRVMTSIFTLPTDITNYSPVPLAVGAAYNTQAQANQSDGFTLPIIFSEDSRWLDNGGTETTIADQGEGIYDEQNNPILVDPSGNQLLPN